MAVYRRLIPSTDPRLGRHVKHDGRSRSFAFDTSQLAVQSVVHPRHIGILNQGQVGSCTGNAGVGVLATDPLFGALPATMAYTLDEDGALRLYSAAEDIDGDGPYPPNDNGSSGLSIAKAVKNAALVSGYQHTFSTADALKALSVTPVMIGSDWTQDMFTPDPDGRVHPSGTVRGGHEYVCREVDADRQVIWCDNSWGNWGLDGRFYLTFADFDALLSRQGDVTVLLPLTQPAPTPNPTPDATLAAAFRQDGWITARHTGGNSRVARAGATWLEAKGL